MTAALCNLTFELVENDDGHAAGLTRLSFDGSVNPTRGTYQGPNVVFGHAIVEDEVMLYHALDTSGGLSAGRADVEFDEDAATMTLRWRWLTGEGSGVSVWRAVNGSSGSS